MLNHLHSSDLFPEIPNRTYIMGIMNLTPDSFSGDGLMTGGDYVEAALAQAERFLEDGVDVLDLAVNRRDQATRQSPVSRNSSDCCRSFGDCARNSQKL